MNPILFLVALSPVLLVLILLVILRLPATKAMPLSWLIHALLAFFFWRIPAVQIAAASLEGFIIAASVVWIIFGAVFLLNILRTSDAIETIRHFFTAISPDRRVQLILIAWSFGSFLEGAAGFGTPAAICAPLLVTLGFPPLAAVVLALIANSYPVTYGGVGTTFLVGVTQGLQQSGDTAPLVAAFLGNTNINNFIQAVSVKSALLNWLPGTLLPLLLVAMLTRFWGANKSWREGLAVWKFALLAGFTFTSFSVLIAATLGPEFPSLLAGMFSMLILIPLAKKGILVPKETWNFIKTESTYTEAKSISIPVWKALMPYMLVTIILLLSRMRFLPFKELLNIPQFGWSNILDTQISTQFAWLYSPGAIFTLAALISYSLLGMNRKQLKTAFSNSITNLVGSVIALGTAVPMVRIFINSGINGLNIGSMPVELATSMAVTLGASWPLFAPYVGALGAFISGSATFSNLMFILFQFGAAIENKLDPILILALQTVGAALGNMICVVNVVAASSVVGLTGSEGKIIRYTLIPALLFVLLAGLISLFFL